MAIVGMPNVGKSTTFNIMSKLSVPAENYPFCTIDPNTARVPVPDLRYVKVMNFLISSLVIINLALRILETKK